VRVRSPFHLLFPFWCAAILNLSIPGTVALSFSESCSMAAWRAKEVTTLVMVDLGG
jgi:hypothetical protein